MRLIDVLRLATRNFRGNRLRTFLTILAVSVATAAILFLVSFGYGLQLLTVQQIANSATISTIDVLPAPTQSLIKLDDIAVEKIKKVPDVINISRLLDIEGQAELGSIGSTVVHAVDGQYFELADVRSIIGSTFDEKSDHSAVVSTGFLNQFSLPESESTLGKSFSLNFVIPNEEESSLTQKHIKDDLDYKITGIVKEDDISYIYIPLANAQKHVVGIQYANIKAQASDRSRVLAVKDAVNAIGYDGSAPLETLKQIDSVFAIVQITLGTLGLIALIISSIGMFNTMTISLLERTRDIGIMKALGADRGDVWKMFLAESSIIGFAGGVTGVLLGTGLAYIANTVLNVLAGIYGGQQATLFYSPPWFVLAIIIFSTLVGFMTGFYPARRAAGLNPLKALRYE